LHRQWPVFRRSLGVSQVPGRPVTTAHTPSLKGEAAPLAIALRDLDYIPMMNWRSVIWSFAHDRSCPHASLTCIALLGYTIFIMNWFPDR
jgi:hypothetical protein